jgi:hypothetical protein
VLFFDLFFNFKQQRGPIGSPGLPVLFFNKVYWTGWVTVSEKPPLFSAPEPDLFLLSHDVLLPQCISPE